MQGYRIFGQMGFQFGGNGTSPTRMNAWINLFQLLRRASTTKHRRWLFSPPHYLSVRRVGRLSLDCGENIGELSGYHVFSIDAWLVFGRSSGVLVCFTSFAFAEGRAGLSVPVVYPSH